MLNIAKNNAIYLDKVRMPTLYSLQDKETYYFYSVSSPVLITEPRQLNNQAIINNH